jgi:hypothetical protein
VFLRFLLIPSQSLSDGLVAEDEDLPLSDSFRPCPGMDRERVVVMPPCMTLSLPPTSMSWIL